MDQLLGHGACCGWQNRWGGQCRLPAHPPMPDETDLPDLLLCDTHWNAWRRWLHHAPTGGSLGAIVGDLRKERDRLAKEVGELRTELTALLNRVDVEREGSPGIVYVLRDREGLIKIGWTNNLSRRLGVHRRERGRIELLGTISGGIQDESALHRRFAGARAPGRSREWFRQCPAIDEWIASIQPA